jgi:rhodanese-related sulfurtransferase
MTNLVDSAHAPSFIPEISKRQIQRLPDTDTVFIDARFARDFEGGHLKGAISVPVDANDVERRKATAHISKDAHIVLYCQSAACKFAETVAIKLMDDGFSNISIFRGGWAEWLAKNGKPKEGAL